MIRLLTRIIGLIVVFAVLFFIFGPGIIKNLQTNVGNLSSQADASATVVSHLKTPVAAISTTAQAAVVNPTVVSATPGITPTPTSGSNALSYSGDSGSTFRRLVNQFPDTGVAPPGGGSYDNYTFPRKY